MEDNTEEVMELEGTPIALSEDALPIYSQEFLGPDNGLLTLAVQETADGKYAIFVMNSEYAGFVIDIIDDAEEAVTRAKVVTEAFEPKEEE
jgi:hypothetical protein